MKKKGLTKPIIEGPPLKIYVGLQRDGYVFQLRPRSRGWLEEYYPEKQRISTVVIGFDLNKRQDFSEIHESVWEHVCHLLTGFSMAELNQLGGFVVVKPGDLPVNDQEVYHSLRVYA